MSDETDWKPLLHGELGWAVVRHEWENCSWGRWYYPSNGAPEFFADQAAALAKAAYLNANAPHAS